MATIRCNACKKEVQGSLAMPPHTCPHCSAKGKGFSAVEAPNVIRKPGGEASGGGSPSRGGSLPASGSGPGPRPSRGASLPAAGSGGAAANKPHGASLPPAGSGLQSKPAGGMPPQKPPQKPPQNTLKKPPQKPPQMPPSGRPAPPTLPPASSGSTAGQTPPSPPISPTPPPPQPPTPIAQTPPPIAPTPPPIAPTPTPIAQTPPPPQPSTPIAQTPAPPLHPPSTGVSPPQATEPRQPTEPASPPVAAPPPAAPQPSSKPAAARPERLVWRYPEQAAPGARPLRNPPAEDSGGRLFLCSQEKVVAFLALPNEIRTLWEFSTGGYIPSSPAVGPDQRLRVHSSDGKLYLLDNSGNVCCAPADVGEPLAWASPLVDQDNTTWICAYQGGLLRIDAQGQLAKRPYFRTFEQFNSTGLLHGGVLYVGAEDNCVYAIQLNGPRGVNLWDHFADRGRTGWNINSALAVLGESAILVAGRDDHLHAFQLDGERMWSVAMPGQMLGSPVVDEQGAAYAGVSLSRRGQASGGMLVRIDPNTHRIHWQYDVPAAIESTPVLGDDGMVYFGDNSGTVHAVDRNGQPAWTEQLESPIRSPGVLIGPGRVAFGLDDGSFVALRCSSQRLADRGWPKYLGTPQQHGISPPSN